eukprot:8324128-Ditylum_brightwellii.AAC.1
MIDLASSGLKRSTQVRKPLQHFGFFTLLLGASAVMWTQATQVPTTLKHKAIYHTELAHSLYDETINHFSPMAFAANQQQNETYTFNGVIKQEDRKDFIMTMLDEIKVHGDREHWTLMKRTELPADKRVNGK